MKISSSIQLEQQQQQQTKKFVKSIKDTCAPKSRSKSSSSSQLRVQSISCSLCDRPSSRANLVPRGGRPKQCRSVRDQVATCCCRSESNRSMFSCRVRVHAIMQPASSRHSVGCSLLAGNCASAKTRPSRHPAATAAVCLFAFSPSPEAGDSSTWPGRANDNCRRGFDGDRNSSSSSCAPLSRLLKWPPPETKLAGRIMEHADSAHRQFQ